MEDPQEHRGLVPSRVLADSTTTHSHPHFRFAQIHRSPACVVMACTLRPAPEFLHLLRPSVSVVFFASFREQKPKPPSPGSRVKSVRRAITFVKKRVFASDTKQVRLLTMWQPNFMVFGLESHVRSWAVVRDSDAVSFRADTANATGAKPKGTARAFGN